jgi:hypothetical protein
LNKNKITLILDWRNRVLASVPFYINYRDKIKELKKQGKKPWRTVIK